MTDADDPPDAATRAEEFTRRVEHYLSDLPPNTRSRLIEGLADHLAEVNEHGTVLVDDVGTPEAYAAELRQTLGVDAAGGDRSRSRSLVAGVTAGVLLLAAVMLAVVLNNGNDDQVPSSPTPTASPNQKMLKTPTVVGLKLSDAQDELKNLGLAITVTEKSTSLPPNTVVAQDPEAGSQITAGEFVRLVVSR